ncbi:MAG: TrmH family RNA methyltransferase [Chitinophagales bacterium]
MLSKAQIKFIQSLRQKKYRQKYAQFMIEGDKIVKEAIATEYPLKLIAATQSWLAHNAAVIPKQVEVVETTEQEIAKASNLQTPQPVIAIASQRETNRVVRNELSWEIALDNINDPGNFGTIIRSADWFGVKNVFCSHDCVDVFNPKVIQASMGSVFRVEVAYVDLKNFLSSASQKKYAATLNGTSLYELKKIEPGILLVGNESHGINEELGKFCEEKITIPKTGGAESLNAAVACSIILSHVVRS